MSKVGYGNPPAGSRFSKGKSGNPKGRPKGSSNFLTLLDKELAQSITVNENGKKKKITRLQAMVKRIVAGALQGDLKALMALVEILRRNGALETADTDSLLPDDYVSLLDAYVTQRQKSGSNKST